MEEREPELSIVIPLYNEGANIPLLHQRLKLVLDRLDLEYEILLVDDGSTDNTFSVLLELQKEDKNIKIIKLRGNFGQTAALAAGFDQAQGEIIISMDGDLQHDPQDIPRFLEKIREGYDIVSGWRENRIDSFLLRRLPSGIANWMMRHLSGIDIRDFGTTFKAYKREILKEILLYGDFHRFIPALAAELKASIAEISIKNTNRLYGKSNYNLCRTLTVLFDLIRIKFLSTYLTKPLQAFGLFGLVLSVIGFLVACFLTWEKYAYHLHIMIERGPLLLLSILLMIVGVQFFALGLLSEILVRSYYDNRPKKVYSIKGVWTNGLRHEGRKESKE
jgi:glycosyltransferase involved in cell wall biosynthesis